jgi:hypothetical protein
MWVTEGGETFQPLCIIWLTAEGELISCEAAPPQQIREKAVECFYAAVRDGARERPSRVRTQFSEVHFALAAGLPPGLDVELAGTPELDTVIKALARYAAEGAAKAGTPVKGEVLIVPPLYRVSAKLFDMRPWDWLSEDDVLTVSSPELALPWGGVIVSRNYHAGAPGLLIFSSRYDAGVYPPRKREGPPWNGQVPFHSGILFCDPRQGPKLDANALRRLAEFGWDAPSNCVPTTMAFGPSSAMRSLTLAEYAGLAYVQFAFTVMFSDAAANAEVVGDLVTCRLRLRLEEATVTATVNLSLPAKALERARRAL